MAKWSRIETVLTPFLMAKQAREQGNIEASEGYAKRATDMMGSLVEMAKLKQQIDMAPSEIDYKKALSKQAYATAGESEQRAEKSRYDIERQKQTDIDFAKVAQGLGLDSTNPEVMKNLADVIKSASAGQEYKARTAPGVGYYGAQVGTDISEFGAKKAGFDYTKSLYDQRVSQEVAPREVGAEKVGFQTKEDFGYDIGKTGLAMDEAKLAEQEFLNSPEARAAYLKKLENQGIDSGRDQASAFFTGLARENSIETNIRGYTAILTALDSGDSKTANDALSSAMSALGIKDKVTNENREQLRSLAKNRIDAKIKALEAEKAYVREISGKFSGIEIPKPESPAGIPVGGTVKYSKESWDRLPYEKQKVLFDRHKIVGDKTGEPLPLKPAPTKETKPTKQAEKPVGNAGTGNKVVEKKSTTPLTDKQKKLLEKFAE